MEFRVLGAVEVRAAGRALPPGSPQQAAVLVALLIDAGRLVPVQTLIDRVWGPEAPERARRTLHTHLTRIRRLLEQSADDDGAAPVHLQFRTGGYLLQVDPARVDAHRFRELVGQATGAPTDRQRIGLLRAALDLWRGEPLAGLPGEWADRVREGLRQRRLDALVAWGQAHVRLDNPAEVIGPLTELAAEYPLLEPPVAVLMRALAGAGRTAEALEQYAVFRRRLVDQLGTEPGAELRALQIAALRGELSPPAPGPVSTQVPAQLPLDVRGFTGRSDELARLDRMLASAEDQPTAVTIAVLSGTAGVGKTALAVHWAHQVRQRFPDGQLYADLRGYHPTGRRATPAEVVRGFLDAFAVPAERLPVGLAAQVNLYRSLLAERRVLIVLDNARDVEQVRPLLPGGSGCLVLVTSRDPLTSLVAAEGARPFGLDLLSRAEAEELLARRLGKRRVATEPTAVEEIIRYCARLPLALTIVAARAATHPGFPLAALASELRDARRRLDALAGEDAVTDVRAVFSWSYHTLSEAAGRLFRLLGLHPGPDLGIEAVASLAGSPVPEILPLLRELRATHLVTELSPGRYACHDLLRAYAGELAAEVDPVPVRRAAVHRVLDHYLLTGTGAAQLLEPHRQSAQLAPAQPGVTLPDLADGQQAWRWFLAEHPVMLAVVQLAADEHFDGHAWQLAWSLSDFMERRGLWQEWRAAHRIGLAAARRSGDRHGQAHAHRSLARACVWLGESAEADEHLSQALTLFEEVGDRAMAARTHANFAELYERQARYADALDHASQALALFQASGHRYGEALTRNQVGWFQAQLGDYEQALVSCQRALEILTEMADRSGQAATWDSLGYAHHHLGHHTEAARCYNEALALYRSGGNRYYQADTLSHLGDTQAAGGDLAAARRSWQQALVILEALEHPTAEEVRARLAGR